MAAKAPHNKQYSDQSEAPNRIPSGASSGSLQLDADIVGAGMARITFLFSSKVTPWLLKYKVQLLIGLAAIFVTGNVGVVVRFTIWPLYNLLLRIVGWTLGVGFGLGLATHVYDNLDRMQASLGKEKRSRAVAFISQGSGGKSTPASSIPKAYDPHDMSYEALMASAGYDVHDGIRRGQVVKDPLEIRYKFSYADLDKQFGPLTMQQEWPTIPRSVNMELGRLTEFVMRDFISIWYSLIDPGCIYTDPTANATQPSASETAPNANSKHMIYSKTGHTKIPMLDQFYRSLAIIFGNLANRVEDVNIFQLTLLKWTKVIAHTFKVYRELRKQLVAKKQVQNLALFEEARGGVGQNMRRVAQKAVSGAADTVSGTVNQVVSGISAATAGFNIVNQPDTADEDRESNDARLEEIVLESEQKVSEMAMMKQFLVTRRLHPAVTFGLEIPSLLFADSSGKECGKGGADSGIDKGTASGQSILLEEQVLEQRYFGTKLMADCELDYNRVLAHRMVRLLIPRSDFGSPIVSTLLIEIMASNVLSPLMAIFSPDLLNTWILQGLEEFGDNSAETNVSSKSSPAPGASPVPQEHRRTQESLLQSWTDEDTGHDVEHSSQAPHLLDDAFRSSELMIPEEDYPQQSEFEIARTIPNHEIDRSAGDFQESRITVTEEEDDEYKYQLLTSLSAAILYLEEYVNFEESRRAKVMNREEFTLKWDDAGCQGAVLKLAQVIEAWLMHGRRPDTSHSPEGSDGQNQTRQLPPLSLILMEMTNNVEEFENQERISSLTPPVDDSNDIPTKHIPSKSELATIRTLIAAWFHTGQLHRVVSALFKSKKSVLVPYYYPYAALRSTELSAGFQHQLRTVEGVDIMMDTAAFLEAGPLEMIDTEDFLEEEHEDFVSARTESSRRASAPSQASTSSLPQSDRGLLRGARLTGSSLMSMGTAVASLDLHSSSPSTKNAPAFPNPFQSQAPDPPYLQYHRNEAFASSLRSERQRRTQSWNAAMMNDTEMMQVVCRMKGASEQDFALHRELHHVARIFYAGTNLISIRDAARSKKETRGGEGGSVTSTETIESSGVSVLAVEMACSRRRIEVPDDDSSFLLRAQPRLINAVGVHRDQRHHDLSFRCFAGTYQEPVTTPLSNRYTGGHYVRRCLIRYYPSDRVASVAMHNDSRKLDQRKGKSIVPETIRVGNSVPYLSADFLRERHLCKKHSPQGSVPRAGSLLSSSLMEPSDFVFVPRTGKAMDFIYRMSLFEHPMIELGGRKFTCDDAASMGTHRADASSLEMSDAALSLALLTIGRDYGGESVRNRLGSDGSTNTQTISIRQQVEMGPDGYPIIWMKYSRKHEDATSVEIKPYRVSFIRAAMLITSARFEAQLQCLVQCVHEGSIKSATKARTDAQLRPTLRLLDFARHRSREKQAMLLRDLKLGINNVDREQLRRNALLSPRYPTRLLSLDVKIEDTMNAKDVVGVSITGNQQSTVYKIRCVATVEIIDEGQEDESLTPYRTAEGVLAKICKESWVVYRPFRDFQFLHKHLKTQVASGESSGTAGSRLVGAATAAFTVAGGSVQGRSRQREPMIPSMLQATKAVALGVTRKAILKRKEVLEGYLQHLLSPGNHLNRSTELLLFVGAFYPLPPDVLVGMTLSHVSDALGRAEMAREFLEFVRAPGKIVAANESPDDSTIQEDAHVDATDRLAREMPTGGAQNYESQRALQSNVAEWNENLKTSEKLSSRIPAIANKIDKISFGQVRNRVFELLSYQFGFENASFFRSRMLSALKTASFAVTSGSEFRKMLYKTHVEQLNSEAIAGWLKFALEMIWPDGVFVEEGETLTAEQKQRQAEHAKERLHQCFPEQLRTVLGQDLTRDGLNILHEMLQNRIVVRSMFYMLFDLLWQEVFPEIQDILSCGQALDINSDID